MPCFALLMDNLPTEAGEVVGSFGILIAYAMLSSGGSAERRLVSIRGSFSKSASPCSRGFPGALEVVVV